MASERTQPRPACRAEVVLVHSSDLHVDDEQRRRRHRGDGTAGLRAVLATARAAAADLVILAGDTFDSHLVKPATIDRVGRLLADAGLPIVLLPGNHDPMTADCVFVRGGFAAIANLRILGMTHDRAVLFPEYRLEIWGNAHRDYDNMVPLREPRPRSTRWQVAIGHGHYEPPESWATPLRPSWLISDDHIAATGADYLALGHWDRPMQVGTGAVPAYYSGSPDYAGTVNLVRLGEAAGAIVRREPLSSN